MSQKTESRGENHNRDYTMMIYTVNIYKAPVIALSAPHAHFHSFTIWKLYGVDAMPFTVQE